jgi:hypothetical protein
MKIFTRILLVVLIAATCPVYGQSVFLKYGPVAGIQKSTGSTYQNTAAASSDVIGLWSGCTGSNFLRGDGTCTVPAGTGVSSVAVPAPLTATSCSGGACVLSWTTGQTANRILATPDATTGAVSLRAMVAGDVPPINLGSTANGGVSSATILLGTNGGTSNGFFSVTGPATALRTFTFPNASATVSDQQRGGHGSARWDRLGDVDQPWSAVGAGCIQCVRSCGHGGRYVVAGPRYRRRPSGSFNQQLWKFYDGVVIQHVHPHVWVSNN